ncbi:hypothetical protein BH23PLA1_BH23PLA1_31940 [soil metagenome]
MTACRELLTFAAALAALVAVLLQDSLFCGKVLSPADVVFVQGSFEGIEPSGYEPANRLLMDPVLQFEPWMELNREALCSGRLPLWNPLAGCGAPHLANGQSAVFDPFQAIAYLGTLPEALAWMAALRLWVAGLGLFLLARRWGFGRWGRWFSGLSYPFCGFLVGWLLFPVSSVAVWLPWLLWTTERLLHRPGWGTIAGVGFVSGFVLLGGHIQTSAHVLLASGLYLVARWVGLGRSDAAWPRVSRQAVAAWVGAVLLGIALGAIEIVPLGFYLSRSPVWTDRQEEKPPLWHLARPRLAEIPCTALPYLYGSQRREHPHLARAVGADNLNESAGGFAGLTPLLLLAPLGWSARRTCPAARFLAALAILGALGAFRIPPVDNLLRALPVLDVIDHRRLTLWIAFGLVGLGGVGLDSLESIRRNRAWTCWIWGWVAGAILLISAAVALPIAKPLLHSRALDHYSKMAAQAPDGVADSALVFDRAEGQVHKALTFLPRYYTMAALQLLGLSALTATLRITSGPPLPWSWVRAALLALTLTELLGFARGLNPAIPPESYRPVSPVLAYLQREAPPPSRILPIGAELPPNIAMRYGLADVRNYDSVEVARNLSWFDPLYEPAPDSNARTSRRDVTWVGVLRARDRLQAANVTAVISATPPPEGAFPKVVRIGSVWIAHMERPPMLPDSLRWTMRRSINRLEISIMKCEQAIESELPRMIVIPETFDPGWRATVDGRSALVRPHAGAFLSVTLSPGAKRVAFWYDPQEVRVALGVSAGALAVLLALAFGSLARRAKKWPE